MLLTSGEAFSNLNGAEPFYCWCGLIDTIVPVAQLAERSAVNRKVAHELGNHLVD